MEYYKLLGSTTENTFILANQQGPTNRFKGFFIGFRNMVTKEDEELKQKIVDFIDEMGR